MHNSNIFCNFACRKVQKFTRILNVLLIVAAYGYLGYKVATYDNYAGLLAQMREAGVWQWLCLAGCVLLFPLNRFLEAWKWRYLVRGIEPMGLMEAQRQVYYGTIAGFVLPYKIGEYPGRAMLFRQPGDHWLTATCLGLIGGYAMTMVIVLCGLPAAVLRFASNDSLWWSAGLIIAGGVLAAVALPAVMRQLQSRTWKSNKSRMLVTNIAHLTFTDVLALLGISLLRYGCFLLQLLMMLLFCRVILDPVTMLTTMTLYYLLITVTPNVPAAEVAVRGAWAAVLFEPFSADVAASAVIATMLLWAVNTILPLIVGSLVIRRYSRNI